MKEKLKSWLLNDQIFYGFMIILVGISSFALGRISVEKESAVKPGVKMINPIAIPASTLTAETINNNYTVSNVIPHSAIKSQFVASKNGTKYYLPNCSGAKRIKPENLINFPSQEAAEAAGYGKAANCPGL